MKTRYAVDLKWTRSFYSTVEVEAASPAEAEAIARRMWDEHDEQVTGNAVHFKANDELDFVDVVEEG